MKTMIFAVVLLVSSVAFAQSPAATSYRIYASNNERWDGAVWLETDSSRYFYATGQQDTLFYSYTWDDVNMEWVVSFRRYYSFDSNGNPISYLTQLWDGTLFTNYQREERIFNPQNEISSYTHYSWDGANWIPTLRFTYAFDAQGKTTSSTRENYASGSWVNHSRTLYTYSGGFASTIENQDWSAGAWQKTRRTVYTRDGQGNPIVLLVQLWDGTVFVNDYQYVRSFDGNNNILTDTYVDWVSGAWDTLSRHSYTYNAANEVLLDLRQTHSSGTWVNQYRRIYTYINNELLDTLLQQNWTGSNWENYSLTTQQFDINGNQTYGENFVWAFGAWANAYRYFSYYEPYDEVGINEPLTDLGAAVYPNPFAEKLSFKLPLDATGRAEIQLFDMSGKNVLADNQFIASGQQLISISTGNLPAGPYVFVLTLDGKQSRGLITK